MKKGFLLIVTLIITFQYVRSQSVELGSYASAIITNAGGNAYVVPSTAPVNTLSAVAYTNCNFKGLIGVSPITGLVTITNAHPAGTYSITVKAFNSTSSAVSNFILTVNNSNCSQGSFTGNVNFAVGALPYAVSVADFNNDGFQDIVTANYGHNNVSIRLGDGAGGFGVIRNFAVGTNPQSVAISDINGDGKQDIAVTNFGSSNVSILLGDGAGGFNLISNLSVSSYPYSIVMGDFNGDGNPDIATSNIGNNTVSIRIGDGLGNFSGSENKAVGNSPRSITIADFNGDGFADLATGNFSNNNISVLLGNGTGGFNVQNSVSVGSNPFSIVSADFNGDGKADLITANYQNNAVSVRLGNGLGGFSISSEIAVGVNPRSLVTGDFNGDGIVDFATANSGSSSFSIRLGNGTGNFSIAPDNGVGANPYSIIMADFNNDGKQDIATANAGNSNVSIRMGTANDIIVLGNNTIIEDGDVSPDSFDHTDFENVNSNLVRTFNIQNTSQVNLNINNISVEGTDASLFTIGNIVLPQTIPAGGTSGFSVTFIPTSTGLKSAAIHIDNDNCAKKIYDFAIQGTGVSMSFPTLGSYPASAVYAGGSAIVVPSDVPTNATFLTAYTTTDFKGQLHADPVTGNIHITNGYPAGNYFITVKINGISTATSSFLLTVNNNDCSQGLFAGSANLTTGSGTNSTFVCDFNLDGKLDIAVIKNSSNSISFLPGDGNGGFNAGNNISVGNGPQAMAIADFNGDGKPDIATANSIDNKVSIHFGDGSGGFFHVSNINVGANPLSVIAADFNGDGKPDFATVNSISNTVSIRLGDGLGGFSGNTNIAVGTDPRAMIVADFNGDGKSDFAVVNNGSNNVSIRLGDGQGGFSGNTNLMAGTNPRSLIMSDFNADGFQDIAIANYTGNTLSVRMGDGTGAFSGTTELITGANPVSVSIGDFNGDGLTDIATANFGSNNVSVFLRKADGSFPGGYLTGVGVNPLTLTVGDFNGDAILDFVTANAGSADISVRLGTKNAINVFGNNNLIIPGDTTPEVSDHTDFGNSNSSLTRIFEIRNTSAVNLLVKNMILTGADSSMFTIGNISFPLTIAAGGTRSFSITFIPVNTGLKTATVNIINDNCDQPGYNFAIQGFGMDISPTLGNYPLTIINAAGGNMIIIPSAAPLNATNITAYTSSKFKGLIHVNPLTGDLYISNAHPAGTYNVSIKANGISTTTTGFILIVNNAGCSKGLFVSPANIAVGNLPFSIAVADFNNDGKQDIASANYGSNSVSIRLGDGLGGFNGSINIPVGSNPYAVAIADFNGDGNQDFVSANYSSGNVSVRLGDGSGGFTGNTNVNVGIFPTGIVVGDFNADGKQDIAVAHGGNNNVSIHYGDANGNFTGITNLIVGSSPYSIAIGDFNSDGYPDFAAANYNISTVSIRMGNATGGFTGSVSVDVGLNPYSIAVGDFNGDGILDFATANFGNNTVSVRNGNGNGNFSGTTELAVGTGPGSVAIADFNGDGNLDIATANYSNNNVSVRFGNGAGNFSGTTNLSVGTSPASIVIGDFNADGKQDFAVSNFASNNISVRLNYENEINVVGNAVNINNGDMIPASEDHTDFGIGNNNSRSFTIQNKGTDVLNVSSITLNGTNTSSFSISGLILPATIPPGNTLSFTVNFAPIFVGIKTAIVNIQNDDCDESLYQFAVKGEYQCPQLALNFTGLESAYCPNASFANLVGNQSPMGVFSGPGITDNGNGTAVFDPMSAGQGMTHEILYAYTSTVNGCSYNLAQLVTVHPIPSISISGLAAVYCTTDMALTLQANPSGGVFSGPGISGNIFDPSIAGAGIHSITYTYTDGNGCSYSISQLVEVIVCPLYATLSLKVFLEGFYSDISTMRANIYDLGISNDDTETDTIQVNIWSPSRLSEAEPDYTVSTVLHTNGMAEIQFPASVIGNSFYIAVKHRNHLETWSKLPLVFSGSNAYDFSSNLNQAFDDGVNPPMASVAGGMFAFFGGDVNQDGTVDASDQSDVDNDNGIFAFGYNVTDATGDGATDASDLQVVDNNSQLFLYFARPY